MKLINTAFLIATLCLFACQKEEEQTIDPCANGKMDNGETEVDCGGPCTPCYHYPYLVYRFNGEPMQMNVGTSQYFEKIGSTWFLIAYFGGAETHLNIGPTLEVGTYPINPDSSVIYYQGTAIPLTDGLFGISANDLNQSQLSGNFQAHFSDGQQLIQIDDAQFEYLKY